jgi:type II secretory pathway component PulF
MNTPNRSPSAFWAAALLILDALLWFALPLQLILTVPKFKRVFDDFGLKLPDLTVCVVNVSMWFADYWWVVAPAYFAGLVALIGIGFLCRKRGRRTFWTWFLLTAGSAILLNGLVLFAVEAPYHALLEGLSR